MHEVLVDRLGGLSLSRKSVVRLTDRPDMTLDVYRGRKTTMQQQQQLISIAFVVSRIGCLRVSGLKTGACLMKLQTNVLRPPTMKPAIAAMHGPHSLVLSGN